MKKKNGVTDIFFVIFTSDQLLNNFIPFAKILISTNDISFYGTEMQYSHTGLIGQCGSFHDQFIDVSASTLPLLSICAK